MSCRAQGASTNVATDACVACFQCYSWLSFASGLVAILQGPWAAHCTVLLFLHFRAHFGIASNRSCCCKAGGRQDKCHNRCMCSIFPVILLSEDFKCLGRASKICVATGPAAAKTNVSGTSWEGASPLCWRCSTAWDPGRQPHRAAAHNQALQHLNPVSPACSCWTTP